MISRLTLLIGDKGNPSSAVQLQLACWSSFWRRLINPAQVLRKQTKRSNDCCPNTKYCTMMNRFGLVCALSVVAVGLIDAQSTPSLSPVSLPSLAVPEVTFLEPVLWKVILVGKDCPISVFSRMDLIEAEIFTVLQSYVPELSYIPPGDPIARRSLADAEHEHEARDLQISTCPKRWQCKKDAWEGKY